MVGFNWPFPVRKTSVWLFPPPFCGFSQVDSCLEVIIKVKNVLPSVDELRIAWTLVTYLDDLEWRAAFHVPASLQPEAPRGVEAVADQRHLFDALLHGVEQDLNARVLSSCSISPLIISWIFHPHIFEHSFHAVCVTFHGSRQCRMTFPA